MNNRHLDIILGDSTLRQTWVDNIVNDLLSDKYQTATDHDTDIKIAVITHLAERNQLLEQTLSDTYKVLGELGKVL